MSGTVTPLASSFSRICGTAAAASLRSTVMRTSSDPARHNASTCATVAAISAVSVFVIDCTTIGAGPPTTAEVEALLSEAGPPPPATRRTTPLLNDLLDFAANRSPLAATDQDLVDVLHAHGQQAARTLGTALVALGDARVVLGADPEAVRRRQAWVTEAPSMDFSVGDRQLAPA